MNPVPVTPMGARENQRLMLGVGWFGPAILFAALLSLIYLPTHHGDASGADRLIATIAGLYVLAFSVALVRITRGAVLRLAGSTEPIVLLGSGASAILDARIAARWRLFAVAAGATVAAAAAMAAAILGEAVAPTTYAHALADLALIANLALVGSVLVPAPGFTGWALVLAVADWRGSGPDSRIRRASRLAQALGIPMFVGFALLAGLLGDAALMVASILAALLIRMRSRWAEGHDAIARFLADRVVGDLARPIVNRAEGNEPLVSVARRAGDGGVTAIVAEGVIVGAIGPRQLVRQGRDRGVEPVAERMVALGDIPQLSASNPAAGVIPAMALHGFAFVRSPAGLGWVETSDVLAQILAGPASVAGRAVPPASARSGPLGERQHGDDDDDDTGCHGRQRQRPVRSATLGSDAKQGLADDGVRGEPGDEHRARDRQSAAHRDYQGHDAQDETRRGLE